MKDEIRGLSVDLSDKQKYLLHHLEEVEFARRRSGRMRFKLHGKNFTNQMHALLIRDLVHLSAVGKPRRSTAQDYEKFAVLDLPLNTEVELRDQQLAASPVSD